MYAALQNFRPSYMQPDHLKTFVYSSAAQGLSRPVFSIYTFEHHFIRSDTLELPALLLLQNLVLSETKVCYLQVLSVHVI